MYGECKNQVTCSLMALDPVFITCFVFIIGILNQLIRRQISILLRIVKFFMDLNFINKRHAYQIKFIFYYTLKIE